MLARSLLSIPTWNQLADPLPDGEEDTYATTDCGEECAAMRIWYRTGIAMPAGIIRQLIPGHQDRGETSPGELVQVMRLFGLRPVALARALGAIQPLVVKAIGAGIPPILLGYWDDRTILHYVLVVDITRDGLLANDPWGGRRVELSWSNVDAAYAGWCIV